nr:reverse transcriptase domain-containing protein [Tanacetum cinerariifolium]
MTYNRNPEQKKKPQGKVGTEGCPNQVRKHEIEAWSFQITEGEGSEKKNGVQKIGERDTKSCYQSSRSKETDIASEKHRHKREYSRRTEAVTESEGSAGGHWKSKPKKQKSSKEMTYPNHGESIPGKLPPTEKCIKDPVEIHNIKQRNRESTEEFVMRYKLECRDVKGAPECMKISGFMHEITNPELIKRLHDKFPMSMDEMMSVTATFFRGEMAASNRERKKLFPSWKQEAGQKQNFKRENFQNKQRMERKQYKFTLLTKTPIEMLALDKGKFKPPPPMTTLVEKKNDSKFCEFHGEVGVKAKPRKRSGKDSKEGETSGKDKPLRILIVQPWQKIARQRITQTFSPKSVISFPTLREEDGMEGPMIIEAEMEGHCVRRIYVDRGSSSEILYEYCFSKFRLEIKNQLIPANNPLDEFHGGEITLSLQRDYTKAGGKEDSSNSVHSTRNDKILSGRWNSHIAEQKDHSARMLNGFRTRSTVEGRKELCGLLRRHLDEFAWKAADMTGVPRYIAEHRLNVREGCLPVRQKKKGQAPERNKAISEEVKKLVEADIMKEFHYHSWLSNPVMVKKHDDSWRMCVDFKDLNKACPKDGYPLPKIDWKVESLCGYPYKCFLDAYKGYHQIKMAEEDEEKTAFITSQGIFCYSKMPFGLKNAGGTYQRLVDKAFQKQIGRNLKLNPKKYAFGMREGTFLGYKVDANGLRVSPDKVKAVLDLPSPKCLKDVQKLIIADGEKLTEMSGTVGSYDQCGNKLITSLCFKVDTKDNGPYGTPSGTPFSLPVASGNFSGFFGNHGEKFLDNLGYFLPTTSNACQSCIQQHACMHVVGIDVCVLL